MPRYDESDFASVRQQKKFSRMERKISNLEGERTGKGSIGNTISTYLSLPALRAFYPMSGHGDAAGELSDMSGNGKHLTRSGATRFYYDNLAPTMLYTAGGSAYHYHADDYSFKITGTETNVYPTLRGITLGVWCYANTFPAGNTLHPLIAKESGAGTYTYRLYLSAGGLGGLLISSDGGVTPNVDLLVNTETDAVMDTGSWHLVIGRWSTTYTSVTVDNIMSRAVSTQASIYDSSSRFKIGNYLTNYWDGYMSMAFVCAAYLSDDILTNLWLTSKALFDV